jgi:hypothetical protein
MRRLVLRIVGAVLLLAGLAVFPLPVPFGFLLITVGLVLLAGNSLWVAGQVRHARIRSPRFDSTLRQVGRVLPPSMNLILVETDPHRDTEEANP